MFRNEPNTLTAGKYYFAPDDAQHYPGFHNLGSRTWHDTNWEHVVELGELTNAKASWYPGTPPVLIPLPIVLGSTDCIRNGATGRGINYAQLDDGIPVQCYNPIGESNPLWFEVSSIYRCTLQLFYANVIAWMYEDQKEWIEVVIRKWLGPSVAVKFHPAVGNLPAVTTVIHAQFSVAIVDGTRSYQQLALQAFQTIAAPVDRGIFSTLPLWWQASQTVNDHLVADGAIGAAPVMFVGHSYGGIAATVLAARYYAATPTREIRLMTFGMPKPGDDRLAKYLSFLTSINLANDDDLASTVPPNVFQLAPILAVLPLPALSRWNLWEHAPAQVTLERDGSLHPNKDVILDFPTLMAMVERILDNEPQLAIPGHRIAEYISRTAKRCPGFEWPIDFNAIPSPSLVFGTQHFPNRFALAMAQKPPEPPKISLVLGAMAAMPHERGLVFSRRAGVNDNCLDALFIELPFDETYTVSGGPHERWYRFETDASPAAFYHVDRIGPGSPTNGTVAIYEGTSCGDKDLVAFIALGDTHAWWPGVANQVYFICWTGGSPFISTTYRLQIDEGA